MQYKQSNPHTINFIQHASEVLKHYRGSVSHFRAFLFVLFNPKCIYSSSETGGSGAYPRNTVHKAGIHPGKN